jgi:hypothetical protein
MDPEEAKAYLTYLINKNLRITSTDQRIFYGQFKCTDPVRCNSGFYDEARQANFKFHKQDQNVILANTYEYRQPSLQQIQKSAANAVPGQAVLALDMSSRYMGLVVVPGKHILKIEVEEFASQMRLAPTSPVVHGDAAGAGAAVAAAARGRLVEEGEAALEARQGAG